MQKVDRQEFSRIADLAYVDMPHPIGYGATISAPHMHVMALEALEPVLKPGDSILDVGSGSGYLCACFAELVGETGHVVGIDVIKELVDWSIENMNKSHADMMKSGRVKIVVGDGWEGYPALAPYKAIHVGAAASSVPKKLLEQLMPGGRMVIPVGREGGAQEYQCIDRNEDGSFEATFLADVSFVPLVKGEARQQANRKIGPEVRPD